MIPIVHRDPSLTHSLLSCCCQADNILISRKSEKNMTALRKFCWIVLVVLLVLALLRPASGRVQAGYTFTGGMETQNGGQVHHLASLPAANQNPVALLGTAFTYQGRLQQGGGPVDGACDFQFSLWDAATVGARWAAR